MHYKHYKGGFYYTLGMTSCLNDITQFIKNDAIRATHTEDKVKMSVLMMNGRFYVTTPEYAQHMLYIGVDGRYWLRPREMFFETLEDGRKRFELIGV